jgi:hypothetical protein
VTKHSLVALKVILGLSLLSFSAIRQAGMDEREAEDVVNDFGRAPVGESKEETVSTSSSQVPKYPGPPRARPRSGVYTALITQAYNRRTAQYFSNSADDLSESISPVAQVRHHIASPPSQRWPAPAPVTSPRQSSGRNRAQSLVNGQGQANGHVDSAAPGNAASPSAASPSEAGTGAGAKKGKKWKLEEVERWTMVKRIW